jgi:hypothetical protein
MICNPNTVRSSGASKSLRLFEPAHVLVSLNHVAHLFINANHCIMSAGVRFRVPDCFAAGFRSLVVCRAKRNH